MARKRTVLIERKVCAGTKYCAVTCVCAAYAGSLVENAYSCLCFLAEGNGTARTRARNGRYRRTRVCLDGELRAKERPNA